ncbi:hypothetical protein ACA910_010647 [Epithemia clementina (nom. ined.)]
MTNGKAGGAPLHGTHVWVRTDLVEAILDHGGSIPDGWKPRKRTRATDTEWGWCRAVVHSASTAPVETPTKARGNKIGSSFEQTPSPGISNKSPYDIKLRKITNSPSLNRTTPVQSKRIISPGRPDASVSIKLTVDDEHFAPPHLQNVSVSFTYQTSDDSKVCTANAWWSQRDNPEPPADLTMLEQLHEPAVVFCLQHRYESEHIYTYTGKILLALNPFQALKNLYGEDVMQQYWKQDYTERPPPHIYAIAEDAYRSMIRSNHNQSILVSGESGAGKTVTAKIIMRYLATLSQRSEQNRRQEASRVSIEAQVLQSNPILESFGNARTVRNDNSSRFGKFIEIRFDTRLGALKSASIRTYLLEKVRLISQNEGERNYHVFYEVLAALPQKDRKRLRIATESAESFRMTAASGTFDRRDGVSDKETYRELRSALDTVGFTEEEQTDLFTGVCGLLHTSNLTFVESKAQDSSELDRENPSLRSAVALLGVSADALNGAFCQVLIEVNGERLYKNLSIEKAQKAVEATMKATYGALFEHIVRRINQSIAAQQSPEPAGRKNMSPTTTIGVLDIFGFESFETNSFEQLCINHCNEALQQQFNRFVFKLEQQEYEKEGIDWSFVTFPDNQDVLDLIEKKRHGILSILDEQCRLARCTDKSFALAVYDKCKEHPRFLATKQQEAAFCFSIQHYAGIVEYDSANFLEKNKDELPKETTELLLSSANPFLASLGELLCDHAPIEQSQQKKGSARKNPKQIQRGSSSLMRDGVGIQFSAQLTELRTLIESTEPHYVRCLKPNDDLIPNNFDPLIIADQLRCAGVLEAIRVSRVGFPHRYFHNHFVERYGLLRRKKLRRRGKSSARQPNNDDCASLVDELTPMLNEAMENDASTSNKGSSTSTFLGMQMGQSKVFLRLRAFETLERLRSQTLDRAAAKIQAFARMCAAQTAFEIAIYAATIIQKFVRKAFAYRIFREQLITNAARVVQNSYRCYRARRALRAGYYIARWCQSAYRGTVARELAAYLFLDRKAASIQRAWKMHRSTWAFRKLRRAVVFAQARVRGRAAFRELCRLRRDAKDLSNVLAERDKYKEEMARLKEELEREKERSALTREEMRKEKASEVENMRNEIKRLQEELAMSHGKRSPTKSETENLKFLIEEVRMKEEQLDSLRNELDCLRSATDSFSIHSLTLEGLAIKCSPDENQNHLKKSSPVRSDVSLLDSMDEHQVRDCVGRSPALNDGHLQQSIGFGGVVAEDPQRFEEEIRHLHNSIRQGNMHLFSRILEQTSNACSLINEGDRYGRTALHLAAITSNAEVASILVESGAAVNAQDEDGETPLHLSESTEITELLLRKGGANPNIPNIDGITALHLAVQRRDVDAVRSLIRSGADVNNADNIRWFTALHLIALPARNESDERGESDERYRIAQLLTGSHGMVAPDLNDQDREGNTPLHYAVQIETKDACNIVRVLLERGADPNICNERNQGPLHLLCHNMQLRNRGALHETLRNMLSNGADANLQSLTGCTALHLSLYHQDINSAVELVSKGSELHILWKKPKRWESFWNDMGSSEVLALDMVEEDEALQQILSSINAPHKWAPVRTWCMHCKVTIGENSRATHCRHCSRFVCGLCTSSCLPPEYFPKTFGIHEPAWVCIACEKILVARKDNLSSSTLSTSDDDERFSC